MGAQAISSRFAGQVAEEVCSCLFTAIVCACAYLCKLILRVRVAMCLCRLMLGAIEEVEQHPSVNKQPRLVPTIVVAFDSKVRGSVCRASKDPAKV